MLFAFIVTAVGLFRILPIPLLKAMMSRPDQQGMFNYHNTLHRRSNTEFYNVKTHLTF